MVVTRQPTWTPHPTRIPSPTPTPPSVVWADELPPPVVIENFLGEWSPVCNEIAGIFTKDSQTDGTLAIARSTEFVLEILDPMHADSAWREFTWTPDGKQLLYMVSPESKIPFYIRIFDIGSGATVDTGITLLKFPDFAGWMDERIVVFSDYTGGGHVKYYQWDYQRNNVLTAYTLHGITFPMTQKFMPVQTCRWYGCTPFVVLRNQPQSDDCLVNCSSFIFPKENITADPLVGAYFQDWNKYESILVSVKGSVDNNTYARLFMWNVNSDKVTSIASGGVFGSFSPNDNYLAWVTHGPIESEAVDFHSNLQMDPINEAEQPYLQWKEIATYQTIARIPVYSLMISDVEVDGLPFPNPFFSFSPDSQWITIISPGSIQSDNENLVSSNEGEDSWSFNIFHLASGKLLQSMRYRGSPDYFRYRYVVWSPRSDSFVFQDGIGNWQVYQINSRSIITITLAHPEKVGAPSWSPDGRYLRLQGSGDTYIFYIPKSE
jgi:WD40 repeat protein